MATNNAWNNQVNAAIGVITLNSGTNAVSVSTDAAATTVNVATGAGVKTTTLGSTNTTSTTTVQSGSGALNVTATNGALTINSGTGALGISTDASATTVSLATGAAAKTVTLGSTNTTSSLALKYGTSDFTLASATGTVVSALDSGEVTMPLQPAFLAYLGTTDSNVTGDGTVFTLGSGNALTEVFDQGSDFVTTGTFTAPVTGRYQLSCGIMVQSPAGGGQQMVIILNTSNRSFRAPSLPTRNRVTNFYAENDALPLCFSILTDMDSGDTVVWQILSEAGAKTDDIIGSGASMFTTVSGFLAC